MHVIFIAIGMHTYLWMANCNFQLHIFEITAHKELKLELHTLQSTYITIVEFYICDIMSGFRRSGHINYNKALFYFFPLIRRITFFSNYPNAVAAML